MFVTERYLIDGFDMYDEEGGVLGGFFGTLQLNVSYDENLITYELWYGWHSVTVTCRLKDIWSTDELDLLLQFAMEEMFHEEQEYGGYVYYDVDLIPA